MGKRKYKSIGKDKAKSLKKLEEPSGSDSSISTKKSQFSKCDIILVDFSKNPHCPHGPTVLFSRADKKYYACSAYRNRLLCPFYLSEEQSDKMKTKGMRKNSKSNAHENETRLREVHNPENNQGQAQFFFSDTTIQFINSILKNLKFENILSIGTPSIHEAFNGKSLLLDIDRQLEQSATSCIRYNMCNHYFFGSKQTYLNHLKSSANLIVLCDPPFGARLELLINTFKLIEDEWKSFHGVNGTIDFILINPYFGEGKVKQLDPRFSMSDYRIEYSTHRKFRNVEKSPVRLFTTINLSKIPLPSNEYKFCDKCQKFVFIISKHCKICKSCDSRDGKEYYHCHTCQKCFKITWNHCKNCNICHLKDECKQKEMGQNKRKRYV